MALRRLGMLTGFVVAHVEVGGDVLVTNLTEAQGQAVLAYQAFPCLSYKLVRAHAEQVHIHGAIISSATDRAQIVEAMGIDRSLTVSAGTSREETVIRRELISLCVEMLQA